MEIKRAKKGAVIYNKLSGKDYMITSADEEAVYAQQILDKVSDGDRGETLLDEKKISITEKNAICFRIKRDADPEYPIGYTVEDGILYKDGKQVTEQGDIYITEIIHLWNGRLLLAIKNKDEIVFQFYEPERDRFLNISYNADKSVQNYQKVVLSEVVLLFYAKTEEKVKEEDHESTEIIMRYSGVYLFENGRLRNQQNINGVMETVGPKSENSVIFTILKTKMNEDMDSVLTYEKASVIVQCVRAESGGPYLLTRELQYISANTCNNCHLPGGQDIRSEDTFIYLPADEYCDAITFRSRKILDAIKNYRHLIDVTTIDHRHCTTLAFADDNYNVIYVTIKKTRDRGTVITLSDSCC